VLMMWLSCLPCTEQYEILAGSQLYLVITASGTLRSTSVSIGYRADGYTTSLLAGKCCTVTPPASLLSLSKTEALCLV
jgi:hypothetical protein